MTAVVDIYNLALSAIGTRSSVASTSEDSAEAKECNKWYNTTRQQIVQMAPWNCCRKFATLTMLKSAPGTPEYVGTATTWDPLQMPPPGWLYEYTYPADCEFARYIVPIPSYGVSGVPIFSTSMFQPIAAGGPPVRSAVAIDDTLLPSAGKVILTDQENAILCYSFDNTNPDLWDQGFQQTIIYGLAAALVLALTGDKALFGQMQKLANQTVMQARATNGNEGPKIQNVVPDWIRARGIETGWDGSSPMLENFGPLFGGGF